jgi:hypothetical protein
MRPGCAPWRIQCCDGQGDEWDTKDPATQGTRGIAKTEGITIVEPNAAPSKAPALKMGSKFSAKDDLISVLMPELQMYRNRL